VPDLAKAARVERSRGRARNESPDAGLAPVGLGIVGFRLRGAVVAKVARPSEGIARWGESDIAASARRIHRK